MDDLVEIRSMLTTLDRFKTSRFALEVGVKVASNGVVVGTLKQNRKNGPFGFVPAAGYSNYVPPAQPEKE